MSIIIVAYNNGEELVNCIKSIKTYNDLGDDLEIIVIDNSPDDKTYNFIVNEKGIQYFRNRHNGFGRGNNLGFDKSLGRYLLFLNPDTLIIKPCFKKMIELYDSKADCGIVGFKLVDLQGKENYSFNFRFKSGLMWKVFLKIFRKFGIFIHSIMYTTGADILIDRNTFLRIGKFDENIFMYSEEADLAFRVNTIGKRGYYYNSIKIIHLQGMSNQQNLDIMQKRMWESIVYCAKKHGINYKKHIKKEIDTMKLINLFKRRYSKELIEFLSTYLD